jgi:hypothetical protein
MVIHIGISDFAFLIFHFTLSISNFSLELALELGLELVLEFDFDTLNRLPLIF